MLCNDARCPERRYNLKYSKQLFQEAKNAISILKDSNEYHGEQKESADLAYSSALDWYNELLADSKMTGEQALQWIEDVNKQYDAVIQAQKEIEARMDAAGPTSEEYYIIGQELVDYQNKTQEVRSEFSEAYRAFYATYEGQRDLWEKFRTLKRNTPNRKSEISKIKNNINEGDSMHAQQIIAAAIVDRKMMQAADLPIEVANISDSKILNKEELASYRQWLQEDAESGNPLWGKKYTAISERFSSDGETTYWLHQIDTNEVQQIPEYVAKTLYNMPNVTNRVENMLNKHSYLNMKPSDKKSAAYYAWAAAKYDADTVKKYVK